MFPDTLVSFRTASVSGPYGKCSVSESFQKSEKFFETLECFWILFKNFSAFWKASRPSEKYFVNSRNLSLCKVHEPSLKIMDTLECFRTIWKSFWILVAVCCWGSFLHFFCPPRHKASPDHRARDCELWINQLR